MSSAAVASFPLSSSVRPNRRFAVSLGLCLLGLSGLWFGLFRHLSGEWSLNEQYSYGWFVPFFALYLFWLRWEDRPRPAENASTTNVRSQGLAAISALLLLLPIRLFEIANPDWRPLGWLHATCVVTLTFIWLGRVGGRPWLRHFAFPILFIFTAVPWISPVEEPIVQGLMRIIASMATETVTLLGIPAEVQGNLIRISRGVVGVSEACSGVRSLQTSLMVGLLFGELKRLSAGRRLLLLGGAIGIALAANFCRAVFLVWVAASKGLLEVDRWHDFAGYAIVGLVFAGCLALASLLGREGTAESQSRKTEKAERPANDRDQASAREGPRLNYRLGSYFALAGALVWLLAVEIGAYGWYWAHERNLVAGPAWDVQLPGKDAGWHERPIEEAVRQTLRFDAGHEAFWKSEGSPPDLSAAKGYLFFFRWSPGGSSVMRARAHRPDICLPDAGWALLADQGTTTHRLTNGVAIPARHITFKAKRGEAVANTFFTLDEDQNHPDEPRPDLLLKSGLQPDWGVAARIRAVREGIRNLGQQVLEIIIVTPEPIDKDTANRQFEQTLEKVVRPEKRPAP